jgi:hypothetical protein
MTDPGIEAKLQICRSRSAVLTCSQNAASARSDACNPDAELLGDGLTLHAFASEPDDVVSLPASTVEAAPFFQPSGAACGGCLRPTWFGRCRTVVWVISFVARNSVLLP